MFIKSTSLRMVAGLEEISKGDIYIGDNLVNQVPLLDSETEKTILN